jgi:hypothetical protein
MGSILGPFVENAVTGCLKLADRLASGRFWKMRLALIAAALSLLVQFPSYDVLAAGVFDADWQPVLEQCRHPLEPRSYPPESHASKLAFRLTVPVLAHVLQLSFAGLLLLQGVLFLWMHYGVVSLAAIATKDRISAVFLSLGFAFIFPGCVLCSDIRGVFDVAAYALLVWAMCARHPLLVFIGILAANFTDERAFIASAIVFLWFHVMRLPENEAEDAPVGWRIDGRMAAMVVAGVVYLLSRFLLEEVFGLHISSGGTNLLVRQINILGLGMWTGLEGFWVLVALSLVCLWLEPRRRLLAFYLACLAVLIVVAGSVNDVTRSMGYLLPAIFLSARVVARTESLDVLRRLVLLSALICLFPTYYAGGKNTVMMYFPLPFQAWRMIVHPVAG